MNIQAEKIELIKLIADVESEKVLKRIKAILRSEKSNDETATQIQSDPYSIEFVEKMKKGEDDIKAGRTTKIEPAAIWNLG